MKFFRIDGKDKIGNESYIQVFKSNNRVCIFSPEDAADVVLTVKQAKELIVAIKECIKP